MNEYDRRNMDGCDVLPGDGMCVVCHMRPATELHHVVFRSHGGNDGPVFALCGFGNTGGCHGDFHQGRLHARWDGERWWVLRTENPVKVDMAEEMEGWREL